ncbi:hypothetical protein JR316_0003449 [Psilocybe cubensis]|uniref:Mid2 domain-containing protein n=2 Tax=Psilocybe cubensis TaxID=181762 RepID=A0A8H8CMZ1_PSICU|nr:hypothetical protein JR316_0003449 [Psilocybe cubensis]KAH9483971.1 hypothetical protein JR316_0003449 [Psilocybe cubensis]
MASCPANFDWARNAEGMDPCEVATRLKAVCRQDPALAPISPGHSYSPPTAQDQTPCSCSSPVYYLTSACADCQGGSFGSWSNWATRCTNPSVNFFPRPAPNGVTIPNWAYLDVGTNPTFNPAFAKSISPSPPPLPNTPRPTTSSARPPQNTPRPDPTTSSTQAPPASTPDSNPDSPSNIAISSPTNSGSDTTSSDISTSTDTETNTNTSTGSANQLNIHSTANQALSGTSGQATGLASDRTLANAAYSTDALTGSIYTQIDPSKPTDSSGNPIDTVSGSSKKSNAGAIAGGIIGGLLFLVIVCSLVYWLIMRRRRRSRIAPSTAYLATYGSKRPDSSMSSRPLADHSTSVLDLVQGHAERYSPYRDDDEIRDSSAAINGTTSQVQFTQARASSIDHYQRPD